jgi:hypothetical protein
MDIIYPLLYPVDFLNIHFDQLIWTRVLLMQRRVRNCRQLIEMNGS